MKTKSVHKLATSGSGCGDIRLHFQELTLVMDYEFTIPGRNRVGRVRFLDVVAFRFRDELHSKGFASSAYDEVVEVEGSDWLEQTRAIEPSGYAGLPATRHFAVLLSSNGYLEVLADQAIEDAETEGRIDERAPK